MEYWIAIISAAFIVATILIAKHHCDKLTTAANRRIIESSVKSKLISLSLQMDFVMNRREDFFNDEDNIAFAICYARCFIDEPHVDPKLVNDFIYKKISQTNVSFNFDAVYDAVVKFIESSIDTTNIVISERTAQSMSDYGRKIYLSSTKGSLCGTYDSINFNNDEVPKNMIRSFLGEKIHVSKINQKTPTYMEILTGTKVVE